MDYVCIPLKYMARKGKVSRKTKETSIDVEVNIDGKGKYQIDTGVYSDIVQVNSSIYEFEFQLTDSLANEFMLVSSKIIR